MTDTPRLRLAIQRSGRLNARSVALLSRCGIDFEGRKDTLLGQSRDFPLDVMLVRDDDIPAYVRDGVCDAGIVGENVLAEKLAPDQNGLTVKTRLGFGHCRLAIAVPQKLQIDDLSALAGKRIATSYPRTLLRFMAERNIDVEAVELSGSVEIAPTVGIADAICDLVSTGATLHSNGLREFATLLESQAVLVAHNNGNDTPLALQRLLRRVEGVQHADRSKYIMLNAPVDSVDAVRALLPGMEAPTVIPLHGDPGWVAIHAVAPENVFWETMDRLKEVGARSILVTPIEKVIL